jgi:hypothetical protein
MKKRKKPSNILFNLTYLGVTTLAKQGSCHPKRRLIERSTDPAGAEGNGQDAVSY